MGDNLQNTQYPGWTKAWQEKLSEVDEQLVDFYDGKREQTAQALAECREQIQFWFDNQNLEPLARAEWEKVKADTRLLGAEIENRIIHLVQDGRIRLLRRVGQDSRR